MLSWDSAVTWDTPVFTWDGYETASGLPSYFDLFAPYRNFMSANNRNGVPVQPDPLMESPRRGLSGVKQDSELSGDTGERFISNREHRRGLS